MKRKFKIEFVVEIDQKNIDAVGEIIHEDDDTNIVHEIFFEYPDFSKIIDTDIWDYDV